jgi:hypothetical protein
MNNTDLLISLLKMNIHTDNPPEYSADDLLRIKPDAIAHDIFLLIYSAVCNNLRRDENVQMWIDENRSFILESAMHQIICYDGALKLLSRFYANGIKAIALKGVYLKTLYSNPECRTMGDMDIFIADSSETALAIQMCLDTDYKAMLDSSKERHKEIFPKTNRNYMIEFHDCASIINPRFNQSPEDVAVLLNFKNAIWEESDGIRFLTLPYTEHLVYLFYHMANHMLYYGFGLRQLFDVAVFMDKKSDTIDWQKFWSSVKMIGCATFSYNILKLLEQKFETDVMLALSDKEYPDESQLLLETIYINGVYGNKETQSKYTNKLLTRVLIDKTETKSGFINVLNNIFPRKNLKHKYHYALKYPLLLPIAWCHRIFDFLRKGFKISDVRYYIKAAKKIENKVELLRRLDLFPDEKSNLIR